MSDKKFQVTINGFKTKKQAKVMTHRLVEIEKKIDNPKPTNFASDKELVELKAGLEDMREYFRSCNDVIVSSCLLQKIFVVERVIDARKSVREDL